MLEYIDGGDLLNYIMEYNGGQDPLRERILEAELTAAEDEAIDFTFQICRAMAYCVRHSCSLV